MGLWRPATQTQMSTIVLTRGDAPSWEYVLKGPEIALFPEFSPAYLEFRNAFDQVIGTWDSEVFSGKVTFIDINVDDADAIPRGSTFTLTIEDIDGRPRQRRWGMVVRDQARYPEHPDNNDDFNTVQYSYSFGTPGRLSDPAWRILDGQPWVYDNSGISRPNAVAAGNLWTGEFWPTASMLYYAPLKTDAVRLTYNTIPSGYGGAAISICSNYDRTNCAYFYHDREPITPDTVSIGTVINGVPTERVTVVRDTVYENFTAEYNPSSNTYALYVSTDTEPIVEWEDGTNLVNHGEGERYFGLAFQSEILSPGVEISDFWIQDAI